MERAHHVEVFLFFLTNNVFFFLFLVLVVVVDAAVSVKNLTTSASQV